MSLWNKKNKETLLGPLSKNNPIMVQMLGICSALAVTSKLEPAIVMALSVTVVVAFSNASSRSCRKTIPNRIRIIVQLVVAATLVTIVSEVLKAYASTQQAALRLRRADHHELYPHGSTRSLRSG